MPWSDRPRETFPSARAASAAELASQAAARQAEESKRRQRLASDRNRAVDGIVHRREDSSPAIRRLLGYTDEPRRPRRWEAVARDDVDGARMVMQDVGFADEPPK